MHGRVLRAVALAGALALLTSGAALADAGGRGTVTTTQQFRDIPLFPAPRPSRTRAPANRALLTAIAHTGVFHTTPSQPAPGSGSRPPPKGRRRSPPTTRTA